MSVIDLFDRGHGISPDGVYLVADGYSCTYREARRLSLRIANRLLEKGFAPETRGAVLAPNDPVAWTTTLGIWRAGLAWVPINPRGTPDSFHDVLDRFDARVLFFHGVFTEVVGALRGSSSASASSSASTARPRSPPRSRPGSPARRRRRSSSRSRPSSSA